MENEEASIYELSKAWAKIEEGLVQSINLDPEVDSPEDAIERRERDEQPSGPITKTIKLDGPLADLLDQEMQKGDMEWTDGLQGNGPFLPKAVEDYILKIAGNDTEEPFTVRFNKYCSKNPMEPRGAAIEVEYEQGTLGPENQFRR